MPAGSAAAPAPAHVHADPVATSATLDDRLLARLARIAGRYTVPGHTAEDLRQEAALVAWRYLSRHDPERHPPLGQYLADRVRRHLSRLYHKAAARDAGPLLDHDPADARPVRDPGELAEVLDAARSLLTPRQLAVLRHTAAGLTDAETAELLGVSANTVRLARRRAVARLRGVISEKF